MAAEPPQKRPATRSTSFSSSSSSSSRAPPPTKEQRATIERALRDVTRNLVVKGRERDSEPQSKEWRPPLFWALYLDGLMSYEPDQDPANPFTKSGRHLATSRVDELLHERNDPHSEFPWSTIIAICGVPGNLSPELYPGVVYPSRAPVINAGDEENLPLPSNMRMWKGITGSLEVALPSVVTAIRNAQDFRDAMVREMIAQNLLWPHTGLREAMKSLLLMYGRRTQYGDAATHDATLHVSMIRLGRPLGFTASREHSLVRRGSSSDGGGRGFGPAAEYRVVAQTLVDDLIVALANIVFDNEAESNMWIERNLLELTEELPCEISDLKERIVFDKDYDRLWVVARQWLLRKGLENSAITDLVGIEKEERRGIQLQLQVMERDGAGESSMRPLRARLAETPLLDRGLRGFIRFVDVERFDSPIKQAMYVVFYQPAVEPAHSVWCANPATVFSITAGHRDPDLDGGGDSWAPGPYHWFVRNATEAVQALKARNGEQTAAVNEALSDLKLSDIFNNGQDGPMGIVDQYGYLPTSGQFKRSQPEI